ncbi:hypothetical protein KR054_006846 [Drosophila jambulina]|nr:hypothetical protein KR054_006846 [Drosophila jambulina]
MAARFFVSLSVLFALVQGSHILQIEQETVVEAHHVGGVTSGAPIRFPEVRPAPISQSSAGGYHSAAGANPVPRPGTASRPKAAPAPHRPPGGSHNRPLAGVLNNAGTGYGNSHKNRYHNQKAFSIL